MLENYHQAHIRWMDKNFIEAARMSDTDASRKILLRFWDFKAIIILLICYNIFVIVYEEMIRLNANDFSQYYNSAVEFLKNGFTNIYNWDYFAAHHSTSGPIRYLPGFTLIMLPFGLLEYLPALSTFTAILLVCDLVSIQETVKIINFLGFISTQQRKKQTILVISFFCMLCCTWCYGVGQVSEIVTMIMLLSMNAFFTGHEYRGTILLGVSISIKPVTFLIAFFIILYFHDQLKMKIKHAIAFVIPIIPEVIIFLLFPFLIQGFIDNNTVRTVNWISQRSTSFPMIFNLLGIDITVEMLVIVLIVSIFIFRKKNSISGNHQIILCFASGMTSYAMMQSDLWPSQLSYVFWPFIFFLFTFLDESGRDHHSKAYKIIWITFIVYLIIAVIPTPLFTLEQGVYLFAISIVQILATTVCLCIIYGVNVSAIKIAIRK